MKAIALGTTSRRYIARRTGSRRCYSAANEIVRQIDAKQCKSGVGAVVVNSFLTNSYDIKSVSSLHTVERPIRVRHSWLKRPFNHVRYARRCAVVAIRIVAPFRSLHTTPHNVFKLSELTTDCAHRLALAAMVTNDRKGNLN